METKPAIRVESCALVRNCEGIEEVLPPRELRRLDNYTKLGLYAAAKCLKQAGVDLFDSEKDLGLIVASAMGPVKRSCAFMDSILDDGDLCASPLTFSASVHNVVETYITMLMKLRGPCLSISQKGNSFNSALTTAKSWLYGGRVKQVLFGVVDEVHPVAQKISIEGIDPKHVVQEDNAVFFLLSLGDRGELLPELNESLGWQQGLQMARSCLPLYTKDEVQRVIGDFIKTQLARRRKDVLAVFDNSKAEQLLANLPQIEQEKILTDLQHLFTEQISNDLHVERVIEYCWTRAKLEQRVNFRSSGSTGKPVDNWWTLQDIRFEVDVNLGFHGKIKRIVSVMPSHHAFGFTFTVQLPKYLGIPLLCQAPLAIASWSEILRPGDLLVAFPMFLQQLVDMGHASLEGVTVLSSTAPLEDKLFEQLNKAGAARVIEIYGASESGAIGWRDNVQDGFNLFSCWDYQLDEDGCIQTISRTTGNRKVPLPDHVRLLDKNRFEVEGRKDRAVQIAGINVYPGKVERILSQHPIVKEAMVRREGESLKAFVVLRQPLDLQEARRTLRQHLQHLSVHEIPKRMDFGELLPTTEYGKRSDW